MMALLPVLGPQLAAAQVRALQLVQAQVQLALGPRQVRVPLQVLRQAAGLSKEPP